MLISIFSPKGGSGCSTSTCLIAKSLAGHIPNTEVFLIDAYNGDLDSIVGVESESEYGFVQWVESANPTTTNLDRISNNVLENLSFVKYSSVKRDIYLRNVEIDNADAEKFEKVATALNSEENICVVDLGTRVDAVSNSIIASSDLVIMVMKSCYVGLNRATAHPYIEKVDAAIIIEEQGRSIGSKQISEVLKINCIIEIDARRDFARAVDAGVLVVRTPKNMLCAIDAFISDVCIQLEHSRSIQGLSNPSGRQSKNFKEYDRTQNLSRNSFDLFEDSNENNRRDFWADENTEYTSNKGDTDNSDQELEVISHRSRRSAKASSIDVAYTSHLHNAFQGIKSKRSNLNSSNSRSGTR